MLGVKLPNDINKWPKATIRGYLLLSTAGFKTLIKRLREKYGFKEIDHPLLSVIAAKEIEDISYFLNISVDFVSNALVNSINYRDVDPTFLKTISLPIYIFPRSSKEEVGGFFIKVGPDTTETEVIQSYKEIKEWHKHLKKNFPEQYKSIKVAVQYKPPTNLRRNLSIYIAMEKYLFEDLSFYDFALEEEGTTSLKRIVSKVLNDCKKEGMLFNETTIEGIYNRTRKHFDIPTLRQFQNFTF